MPADPKLSVDEILRRREFWVNNLRWAEMRARAKERLIDVNTALWWALAYEQGTSPEKRYE